jgi:hypothetical protein
MNLRGAASEHINRLESLQYVWCAASREGWATSPIEGRRRMNMQQLRRLAAVTSMSLFASGCADLTTFTRRINVADKSTALDIKTRVVYTKGQVTCAEPSPDALTALSASGALSFGADLETKAETAKAVANAAAGVSENSAFIGLRTQSIQLLRDAMYRLCEGAAGRLISEVEFAQLQRRFQSTMLGLLAIEQLTGPVVASQALLTTRSAAQAGPGQNDAGVEKARQSVATAQGAVLGAKADEDQARAEFQNATIDASAKLKTLKGLDPKEPTAAKESAQVAADAAEQERRAKELVLRDKERRTQAADRTLSAAQTDLMQAQSRASAETSGQAESAKIAAAGYAKYAEATPDKVLAIVREVNSSFADEACLGFLQVALTDGASRLSVATGAAAISDTELAEQEKRRAARSSALEQTISLCVTRLRKAEEQREALRNQPAK